MSPSFSRLPVIISSGGPVYSMQPVLDAVFRNGLEKQLMHRTFRGYGIQAAENLNLLTQFFLLQAHILFSARRFLRPAW